MKILAMALLVWGMVLLAAKESSAAEKTIPSGLPSGPIYHEEPVSKPGSFGFIKNLFPGRQQGPQLSHQVDENANQVEWKSSGPRWTEENSASHGKSAPRPIKAVPAKTGFFQGLFTSRNSKSIPAAPLEPVVISREGKASQAKPVSKAQVQKTSSLPLPVQYGSVQQTGHFGVTRRPIQSHPESNQHAVMQVQTVHGEEPDWKSERGLCWQRFKKWITYRPLPVPEECQNCGGYGGRGSSYTPPLYSYLIGNYPTGDMIRIVEEEGK